MLGRYRDVGHTRTYVLVMSPFVEVRTRAIKLTFGVTLKEACFFITHDVWLLSYLLI
jgi:hypothetical protein